MYLISFGVARLTAEILRYISETSGSPRAGGCPETPSALLCGKTGVGGDPSDRAAALPEFRYCPLPRACNTWSENTYKIHVKAL